jgi:hypothetical protein
MTFFSNYRISNIQCHLLEPFGQVYSAVENLVLRARSEKIGSALSNNEFIDPKHEIRKTKQYRMTKIKMNQTKDLSGIAM